MSGSGIDVGDTMMHKTEMILHWTYGLRKKLIKSPREYCKKAKCEKERPGRGKSGNESGQSGEILLKNCCLGSTTIDEQRLLSEEHEAWKNSLHHLRVNNDLGTFRELEEHQWWWTRWEEWTFSTSSACCRTCPSQQPMKLVWIQFSLCTCGNHGLWKV